MSKLEKHKIINYLKLVVGTFLMAIAYKSIYDSAGMVTGGFSGIGIIIRHLTSGFINGGFPMWLTTLILNVPLFLVALKVIGKKFVTHTLLGTICLTIFLAVLPTNPMGEKDYLLAAIFGGTLAGAGIGLVLLSGATTGGTDMLASVIHKKMRHYSVIRIMQILDGTIIAAGMAVFGLNVSLYAIIAIYVTTMVSDTIIEGPKHAREILIISDHYQEISQQIMHRVHRGVTALNASGMFSNAEKKVLLCVVSKKQIPQIKEVVAEIDDKAFFIIGDVREVLGEGFVQNIQ